MISEQLGRIAARTSGLDLLVLIGSRARGESRPASDWDFAYLGEQVDELVLRAALVEEVGTDHVDLVNLGGAGGLVRFRAARDGVPLFERSPHSFEQFVIDAAQFWCDAEPVLASGFDEVLEGLG